MTDRPFNPLPTPRLIRQPSAQWPAPEPTRFPVKTVILLVGITFAAVLFALFPAASSADPRADASLASSVEARPGRDLPR